MGDKAGTQAGLLISVGTPQELAPAAPAPVEANAVFPPPPPLPPPILLEASGEQSIQDGPKLPPLKSEPRRVQERTLVKSGSRALPWTLGAGALGLILCLVCAGVSSLWTFTPQNRGFRKQAMVKKQQFDAFKNGQDGFGKIDRFKNGGDPFDRVIFPPFLGFKDGQLPAPPPPGPPGAVSVIFGPDGKFSHDGSVTLLDPINQNNKRHKLYVVRMEAGHTYQIDMVSKTPKFDAFLYLRDDKDQPITEDDDAGGFPHARIFFAPLEDGIFHIEATYFVNPDNPNPAGDFRLIVQHVN
jgi:hypothetical protein